MWCYWMKFALAFVSMATPVYGQSGDGDWGSGVDVFSTTIANSDTFRTIGDEPAKAKGSSGSVPSSSPPPPSLHYPPQPDKCSVHFSTSAAASARRTKAELEELAYLQAVQRGNQAVVENLEQFVGAELGNQSYEDVIKENIFGIQEDHESCSEAVKKAEEDLKQQLEGDILDSRARTQKIREESLVLEDMLRAAADMAGRLESSSRALHASFARQLKGIVQIHR